MFFILGNCVINLIITLVVTVINCIMRKYRNRNTKQYNSSMINQPSESNIRMNQNKPEFKKPDDALSKADTVRKTKIEPKSKFINIQAISFPFS